MKTTITIETSSPEEAAKILALISGTTSAPAEATPKKKVAKKAPVVQVVEEAPVVEEVEVVSRTEAEVTAKAKELVAAASPAVLRGVLDDIIGAGVKISSAPTDKYDAIYDAVDAKLTEINDV